MNDVIQRLIIPYKDIDTKKLFGSLEELNNLLIPNDLKSQIYQQIIYILVILKTPTRNGMIPHTIITGSSKNIRSKLGKILSNIWISLNIIKFNDIYKNAECIICEVNIIRDIIKDRNIIDNSINESLDWIVKFTRYIQNEHKSHDITYKIISSSELSKVKDLTNKIILIEDNSQDYDIVFTDNIIILSSENKDICNNNFMWKFHINSQLYEILYQELISSSWQFESNIDLNWLKEITKKCKTSDIQLMIFYITLEYTKELLLDPNIKTNVLTKKIILQGLSNVSHHYNFDKISSIYS